MSFATALASYLGGRNQAKAANADTAMRQQQLTLQEQEAAQRAQDAALNRTLTQQKIDAGARAAKQEETNRALEQGLKPFPSSYTPQQQLGYLAKRATAAQAAGDDALFNQTQAQMAAIPLADKDFASATADRQKPVLLHMKLEAASKALTQKYGYGIALEIRKAADAMDRTRYNDTARHDIAVLAAQNAMNRVQVQQGGMFNRAVMAQQGDNARTAATIEGANSRSITADDMRIATAEYEAQMRADSTVGSPTYGQTPGAIAAPGQVAPASGVTINWNAPPTPQYLVPQIEQMTKDNAFVGVPGEDGIPLLPDIGNRGKSNSRTKPPVDATALIASARKALAHNVPIAAILANTPAEVRAAVQAALSANAPPRPLPAGGFGSVLRPGAAPQANPFSQQ